eukprot:Colp12_sorted_trinity150504_noHs@30860
MIFFRRKEVRKIQNILRRYAHRLIDTVVTGMCTANWLRSSLCVISNLQGIGLGVEQADQLFPGVRLCSLQGVKPPQDVFQFESHIIILSRAGSSLLQCNCATGLRHWFGVHAPHLGGS